MQTFFSNLFGSIGKGSSIPITKDFIPTNSGGDAAQDKNTLFLKGEASWLGLCSTNMQYWAYRYCSPLASVIDRLCEADINGELMFLTDDKKEDFAGGYEVKKLKKLFKKPNPIQSWRQFRAQQVAYKKVFGYCPVWILKPTGMNKTDAKYLWNLCPEWAKPLKSQDNFNYFGENPLIESWVITILGKTYTIPYQEVIVLRDGYIEQDLTYGLPVSKVSGLDYAISNICAAMEADNVLLRKKGPLGFISHEPKSDGFAGYIPLTNDDKKELQDDLQHYGLTWDKWQYVITKQGMRWNPMSYNIRDLMTKETAREGIDSICDRFGYPAELMSGKNATYENRRSAEKFLYDTIVIPGNCSDMGEYTEYFGLSNTKFYCDYSQLPILQEDVVKKGEGTKYYAEANDVLFKDSVITLNQYRVAMGIDTVEGDDIYYNDYLTKYGGTVANSANPSNKLTAVV